MSPLVRVLGPITAAPTTVVNEPYGPLQLLGYDLTRDGQSAELALYWQVNAPLGESFVETAQLLDANDRKIAQDDFPPGGDYYPTSLWKAGEEIVVHHHLSLPAALPDNLRLLVGFYRPSDLSLLAPPLVLPIELE
jgi:hypothetical protein